MTSNLGRLAALAMLALALAACNRAEMRARMTVEVETPDGVRSGSSVLQIEGYEEWIKLPDSGPISVSLTGEAVAVDLPDGQTLFALLRMDEKASDPIISTIVFALEPGRVFGAEYLAKIRRLGAKKTGGQVSLKRDNYPLLVRFRDINDPMTVERVDSDDLAASFGAGHVLRSITVEVTDDPVTFGIRKRLSWWDNYVNRYFNGSSTVSEDMTDAEVSAHISSSSFSTEPRK